MLECFACAVLGDQLVRIELSELLRGCLLRGSGWSLGSCPVVPLSQENSREHLSGFYADCARVMRPTSGPLNMAAGSSMKDSVVGKTNRTVADR